MCKKNIVKKAQNNQIKSQKIEFLSEEIDKKGKNHEISSHN